MIIDFIINAARTLITTVFGILPNLPPMPPAIVNAGDWLVTTVAHASAFFKYLYGPIFFNIIVVLLIALLGFEQIYHLTMWIIKKIPGLNVK